MTERTSKIVDSSLKEAERLIDEGEIHDAKTIIALFYYPHDGKPNANGATNQPERAVR